MTSLNHQGLNCCEARGIRICTILNKRFANALNTCGSRMAVGTVVPKYTGSPPSTRYWLQSYKAPAVSQQHRACRKGSRKRRPLRSREWHSGRRTLAFFTTSGEAAALATWCPSLRGNNGGTCVAHSQRHKCSALWNTLFESTRIGCWVTLSAPGAGDDFISKQFSGMAADTPAAFFAYLFLFHCWTFARFLTAAAKSATQP